MSEGVRTTRSHSALFRRTKKADARLIISENRSETPRNFACEATHPARLAGRVPVVKLDRRAGNFLRPEI